MTDSWTDRLSQYVDGELESGDERALEAHLETCAECRRTLQELREVVARAAALEDRPPAASLWPGIAARIGAAGAEADVVHLGKRRRARRVSLSIPQLVAAGVGFLLVGAGVALWLSGGAPAGPGAVQTPGSATVAMLPVASGQYAAAVAELEAVLARNRSRLDSATVDVVEQNLAMIDQAIADARAALAADPSNVYVSLHLAQTMRRKVELLRRVTMLVEG